MTLAFFGSLPDALATQWNSSGEVTSRLSTDWLIPVTVPALFLPALICGAVLFLGRTSSVLPKALRICGAIAWGATTLIGVVMIGAVLSQAGLQSADQTSGPPAVWILSGLLAGLVAGAGAVALFRPESAAAVVGSDDDRR